MKPVVAIRIIVVVLAGLLAGGLSAVGLPAAATAAPSDQIIRPGTSIFATNAPEALTAYNPTSPTTPVRLIFIHHSTGENWLNDGNGQLGLALRDNNYFVSDTNYGWGPADQDKGSGTIGDHTDIPDWYSWFSGPHRATYLTALYTETEQHSSYSRLATNPGGENTIVMFKSCFPNSNLDGTPNDLPAASADMNSPYDVAHAKRIYLDTLNYFAAHQDKLFVVITAPPLAEGDTDATRAANARAFNDWLVNNWLSGYAYHNVAVFDYYDVLTSNGGDPNTNDLNWATGNHHRYRDNMIEHITNQGDNTSAYPTGDSHPSQAGNLKATGEFVPLLNIAWHCWQGDCVTGAYRPSAESGNWSAAATWRDNVVPQSNDAVTITTGTTVTVDINARSQRLVIEPGATLELAANATLTVTNQFVNHGVIRQTRPVNQNQVAFLSIQDGADVVFYQGAVISSSYDLGNVTVSIRDLADNEYCTTTGAASPAHAKRCFEITAQNNLLPAAVRLWVPSDRLNGLSDPRVFRYVAPTWMELSTDASSGVVNSYAYAEATTPGFSKFVIAQASNGPTAVRARELKARSEQPLGGWLLAALSLLLAGLVFSRFVRR